MRWQDVAHKAPPSEHFPWVEVAALQFDTENSFQKPLNKRFLTENIAMSMISFFFFTKIFL